MGLLSGVGTGSTGTALLGAALLAGLLRVGESKPAAAPEPLAVFVHPGNSLKDLSLADLRAIFTLEKQFWPERRRIVLVLPRDESPEQALLLEKVYRMPSADLRKYWTGKLFAGEIPAVPSTARTAARAAAFVRATEGAISVAFANEVPQGLPILSIDGKKPGESNYPLAARPVP
ncbi:MAG: hypothetical protein ACREIU_02370 [Planctomycetota bacterium]